MTKAVIVAAGVLVGLAAIAVVVRLLGPETQQHRLPSESMEPTLPLGAVITLNRDAYEDADPAVGDIVIINPPAGAEAGECGGGVPPPGQMCARPAGEPLAVRFVDRVAALPGERVTMRDGRVVREGELADEPYAAPCERPAGCTFPRPIRIPDDHYLVLGDNRGASDDSRFWGPVPRESILGRVEDCDVLRISCSPVR